MFRNLQKVCEIQSQIFEGLELFEIRNKSLRLHIVGDDAKVNQRKLRVCFKFILESLFKLLILLETKRFVVHSRLDVEDNMRGFLRRTIVHVRMSSAGIRRIKL